MFTSEDIRRLAQDQKSDCLFLSPEDILTPAAADTAHALGIRIIREEDADWSVPRPDQPSARPGFTGALPPLKQGSAARW